MRRVVPVAVVVAGAVIGCGTLLSIDEDPTDKPGADAGFTRLADGALVGPDGEVIFVDGAAPADAADAGDPDAASKCAKAPPCMKLPGRLAEKNDFDALMPSPSLSGTWVASSPPPVLDSNDFISPFKSLKATLVASATSGNNVSLTTTSAPASVCIEVCMKLLVDPNDGPITVLRVATAYSTPDSLPFVEVRVGRGQDEVVTETSAYPIQKGLPKNRWFHLKLEFQYDASNTSPYTLSLDGYAQGQSLAARAGTPTALIVDVGATPMPGHGPITAFYDDFFLSAQ